MNAIDEQIILSRELTILIEESVKASQRAERGDNSALCTMKMAQVVMCQRMLEYYLEDEDCAAFMGEIGIVFDKQDSLYREARLAKDHHMSLIYLARLRLLKTLFRRLADPVRQKLMSCCRES